jgi:carbamate kinase
MLRMEMSRAGGGAAAVITSLDRIAEAVAGRGGTRVVAGAR